MFFAGLSMFGIVGYLINRFGHPPTKASAVPTNKHFNVGKMRKLRITEQFRKRRWGRRSKFPSGKFKGATRKGDDRYSARYKDQKKSEKAMDSKLYMIVSEELAATATKMFDSSNKHASTGSRVTARLNEKLVRLD